MHGGGNIMDEEGPATRSRKAHASSSSSPADDAPRGEVSLYLRALLGNRQDHVDVMCERLLDEYGRARFHEPSDALGGLVGTILSQHTSDKNSHRAYTSLIERFPTWEAVAAASLDEIEESIRSGGLAAQKAPRIQGAVHAVYERFGSYDLSFLATLPRDEARTLLMGLASGIGPKTASCVLLFSLGVPAFCVDTHIQRICARVGLIRSKDSAEKAQHMLEATVPPEDIHAMHVAMIRHGRSTCRAQKPQCGRCPLREVCLYGATEGAHVR